MDNHNNPDTDTHYSTMNELEYLNSILEDYIEYEEMKTEVIDGEIKEEKCSTLSDDNIDHCQIIPVDSEHEAKPEVCDIDEGNPEINIENYRSGENNIEETKLVNGVVDDSVGTETATFAIAAKSLNTYNKKNDPEVVEETLQQEKTNGNEFISNSDVNATNSIDIELENNRHLIHATYDNRYDEMAGLKSIFKCKVCWKVFPESRLLKQHLVTHSGRLNYECLICKKKFTSKGVLTRHQLVHTGERKHKCKECNQAFKHGSHLKRHQLVHSGAKPYKCDVCPYRCSLPYNLRDHKYVHSGERPHSCRICSRKFVQQSACKDHERRHRPKLSCEKCSSRKLFRHYDALERHQQICQGKSYRFRNITQGSSFKQRERVFKPKKPSTHFQYSCETCFRKFTRLPYLNLHKRSHEPKVFSCKTCSIDFSKLSHLKVHQRIHMPKLYSCDNCSRKFFYRSHLNMHEHVHKPKSYDYSCETCPRKFSQPSALKLHQRFHQPKPFVCEICSRKFRRKPTYENHKCKRHVIQKPAGQVDYHSYSCETCFRKFTKLAPLILHRRVHQPKLYCCKICSKKFSRKQTLDQHQCIQKPYSCKVCQQAFSLEEFLSHY